MVKEETQCRVCKGELKTVLNYGEIYPSGFVKEQTNLIKAPLVVTRCTKCYLVQLQHTIDLDFMYRQYWYTSALNKSMIDSLKEIVEDILIRISLKPYDVVVDIGCNDGTLLKFYPENIFRIGYDPSFNLEGRAKENCNIFINDYFSAKLYPDAPKAKIITSIAMFYDLPNPNEFIENIKEILDEDGIWVIQLTDLLSMIKANAFDNVCHEHLEYYSLLDLVELMKNHGLQVFDVQHNWVNGGSIRVFVCWEGKRNITNYTGYYLYNEFEYLKSFSNPIEAMNFRVQASEELLKAYIQDTKSKGKSWFILGASTKGNTLLQVWNFTKEDFPYALEVNSDKFGLRTVGSDIPIISEEEGLAMKPDFLLLLPWHFIDTVKIKLDNYLKEGGTIVTPLPNFAVHFKKGGISWILETKASVFL